ncbi:MAG: Ig-like domain-containing protein [Candidatus Limnocylindrales bacterium]
MFTIVALSTAATPSADAFKSTSVDPRVVTDLSTTVVTGHGLVEPATIVFSVPVDQQKVTAALRVTPATPVRLTWSPDGALLHVAPVDHWAPDTLYTLGLDTTAVGRDGSALPTPLSAVFLTRNQTTASLAVQPASGAGGAPSVALTFTSPVTATAVSAALTVVPAIAGRVTTVGPLQDALNTTYVWRPSQALAPGTTYSLGLSPDLRDADGVALAAGATIDLAMAARPAVVRTRPAAGATGVALDQAISVRFSQAMDRASTQAAFHVTGFAVPAQAGRFSWAEGDTVLVWTPTAKLGYGSHYTIHLDGTATSKAGVTMTADPTATAAKATFSTVARPVAKPKAKARTDKPKPGGGSSTSAPWASTERYFLSLINCDHTGGWVSSSGVCTGRGTNGRAALTLSAAVSNGASRPWAKYLAQTSQLYHGCPSCRLSAIGYGSGWWGENLAWWSGTPTEGAIQAILFFQSEKAAKGGHYMNMMDARGRIAGVGVWQANGRVVFCIDFVS